MASPRPRKRRPGATATIGVSLEVRQKLKELAADRHEGNVSELITEMTEDAVQRVAFERAWQWYGGPELTDRQRARIDKKLEEGWELARKQASSGSA